MSKLVSFSLGMTAFAFSFLLLAVISLLGAAFSALATPWLHGAVFEALRLLGMIGVLYLFTRYAPGYVHAHFSLYVAGVAFPAVLLAGFLLLFPRVAGEIDPQHTPGVVHVLPFLLAILVGLALGRVRAKALVQGQEARHRPED